MRLLLALLLPAAIVSQDPARRGWIWQESPQPARTPLVAASAPDHRTQDADAPRPDSRWTGAPCVLNDVDGDGAREILVLTWHEASGSARSWILSGATGDVMAAPYLDRGSYSGVTLPCRRDLDGDGWDDWTSWQEGATVCHSTRTGDLLDTLARPRLGANWEGWSCAGGDVDGDGFTDLVVRGLPFDTDGQEPASVRVFSGRDGGLLFEHRDPKLSRGWASDVIAIGDQDGDARDDMVIASWDPSLRAFVVEVISTRDGSLIRTLPDVPGARDRIRLRDAGDLDGDGVHDLLVSSGLATVRLHSGHDGRLLFERRGEMPRPGEHGDPELGYGFEATAFVDGAGRAYVLLSAARAMGWSGEVECWAVNVQRCAFVARMPSELGDWHQGASLEVCGDANGDGTPDFVCVPDRCLCANAARFHVCSGRTGAVLWSAVRTLDGIAVRR
jgi:hypothetical protein